MKIVKETIVTAMENWGGYLPLVKGQKGRKGRKGGGELDAGFVDCFEDGGEDPPSADFGAAGRGRRGEKGRERG